MKLVERPVRSIVRAVADAAARWADADFPPRVRALGGVCARTGYSLPVVEYALDRLFSSLTESAIEAVIVSELGSLRALDEFVERQGRPRARALPIGRVCVISSRSTIGVAIVPAVFALCAKCDVLVKDREDALVAAFFATLADELDELREAAIARPWDGRDAAGLPGAFDAVVAYGSDETLTHIRRSLPIATRMVAFGAKASCGYVAREALADAAAARRVARDAARDLVLYETEGCLSLHVLFAERGGAVSSQDFAALLGREVERAAVEFPVGARDVADVVRIAGARDAAVFRAAGGNGAVYSDASASYVTILDPPESDPPAFLARTLGIRSVDSPAQAAEYVERHRLPIEALAVAGLRPDLTALAIRIGAARIAPLGRLQSPPLGAYHGGRPRVSDFIFWLTDET
ncbi:MAG TPA: acyl-CoA reductase [Candidatus Tumulicola sp.]